MQWTGLSLRQAEQNVPDPVIPWTSLSLPVWNPTAYAVHILLLSNVTRIVGVITGHSPRHIVSSLVLLMCLDTS